MERDTYSIGEFSQRSGLTARALRLYAENGLLTPAYVDTTSGYRFYIDSQLHRASVIASLRAAGVPVPMVATIVDADLADAHLLVDRWWAGVVAEHGASAALLPRIHLLLEGRSADMSHQDVASPEVGHFEAAVRAVIRGDVASLDLHVRAAPDITVRRGSDGRTLLSEAARAITHDHALPSRDAGDDHRSTVVRLLDAGADPSAPDANGWTPIHSAAISGHVHLAGVLLDAGARTDSLVEGRAGSTPLGYALFYGHNRVAELLARRAPDPDDLRNAAGLGDIVRMSKWLDAGRPLAAGASAGMEFYGPPEWFPPRDGVVDDQLVIDESLTWAARCGRIEAMELLVTNGANVNASPYRGTPLLWAIYSDSVTAAEWLLDHGADPDLRHDYGGSGHGVQAVAMHLAAQYGSLRCLQLLLDRGADATIVDAAHGGTPLGAARFGEQPEAIALLERHLAR